MSKASQLLDELKNLDADIQSRIDEVRTLEAGLLSSPKWDTDKIKGGKPIKVDDGWYGHYQAANVERDLRTIGSGSQESKMLSEAGIVASDDILSFVVKDDAEGTQEAVNALSNLVNELADKKVSEMLKGKTPKRFEQSTTGAITKKQFDKMGYKDRNELLQNNPELYHQLKG